MKKIIILFSILFVSWGNVQAAEKKKQIIYLENFTFADKIQAAHVKELRHAVLSGLMEKDRVLVKDAEMEASLKTPVDKKKGATASKEEKTLDGTILTKYQKLKADYVVLGHVTILTATSKTRDDGTIYFVGAVQYTLKIIDVNTGAVEGTESYKYPSGLISFATSGETPEKAVLSTIKEASDDMGKFIDKYFQVSGKILQISKSAKGKAQEVYIDLGSSDGIQKGQKFEVFVEKNVAGRVAKSKLGEIQAIAVEGADLTRCKVNGGKTQEAIQESVDNGDKIYLKTMVEKKSILSEGKKMFGL